MQVYVLMGPAADSHEPPCVEGLFWSRDAAIEAASRVSKVSEWDRLTDDVGLTLSYPNGGIAYRIEAADLPELLQVSLSDDVGELRAILFAVSASRDHYRTSLMDAHARLGRALEDG